MHRKYHKFVTRRKRLHAHDENNECKIGDEVVIQESRPLSRTKRWIVVERRPTANAVVVAD
jgi:small subunit ribosomal protein S17